MSRLQKKNAVTIGDALQEYLTQAKLSRGINIRRIYAAWDQASGVPAYTIRRYFKDGTLYVTLKSSVVRNQLSFQKKALLDAINTLLSEDELFIKNDPQVSCVTELILK